ncbi:MAG: carbohydrate ABC transporter permease [Lachnospiraceae bacterium]|nr:carbohydrate ABC transporter permease [Lachnospiraceae bacterium]
MKKAKKVRLSFSDKVFYSAVTVFLTFMGLIVLYPLINVVSCSFSKPEAVISGDVILLPVEFTLEGYMAVFRTNRVLLGFRNSAFYTVAGTLINLFMTIICAYPLSRRDLPGQGRIMMLFTFTMIFGGGMIPNYLLIKDLHMLNTVWALLIPGAIAVYHMIVMKTFFQSSIPGELLEASQIDGCTDIKYLTEVVLPLSKSIIAVVTLYYAVGHWNAYFSAFMYLSDQNLYPLQLFLREILISSKVDAAMLADDISNKASYGLEYVLKYSLIVVATVPMLIIYPFVQKHFVKGVMIGAVKG